MRKNKLKNSRSAPANIAKCVRKRIEDGGERIWRFSDFEGMSVTAVAKILSRLSRQGTIQRVGKGFYYRPRQTAFGPSKPHFGQFLSLPLHRKGVFPAGNAAANFLGFSTQNPGKREVATNGLSLPRLLLDKETMIHTRRPESWKDLSHKDAAILDFLRHAGRFSELSPLETVNKLLKYFKEPGQFARLLKVAESEPPRVRAILGAIGEEIGCPKRLLTLLKKSLNPLSRFDFGNLNTLEYASQWQAKKKVKPHEAV